MRPLLACLMLLLPLAQAAAEPPAPDAAPIVPVLKLTIQPPMASVNCSPEAPAIAVFDGTATVDKPPLVRCVVSLQSATDVGWVSQISPTSMVFTGEQPQPYTVTVVVPQGTPTSQGKVKVDGRAVALGLQSTAEVTAIIDVKGVSLANHTAQNRTAGNSTRATGAAAGGPSNLPIYPVLATVLIAAPAVAYTAHRWRGRRNRWLEAR